MRTLYIKQKVKQRRSLSDYFTLEDFINLKSSKVKYNFQIRDIKGLTPGSLSDLAASFSINFETKTLLDDYKSKMGDALIEKTELFLEYGIADASVLIEIAELNVESANNLVKDFFPDISFEKLYTINSIPYTLGSFTYSFIWKYINEMLFKDDFVTKLGFYKLSTLNQLSKDFQKNLEAYRIFDEVSSIKELKQKLEDCPDLSDILMESLSKRKNFKYNPFQYASSEFIQDTALDSTIIPCCGGHPLLRPPC